MTVFFLTHVIEFLNPIIDKNLKIEDKPDLISKEFNLGIEITRAIDRVKATIISLIGKEYSICEKKNEAETKKKVSKMMEANKYACWNGVFTKSWLYENGANSSIFNHLYKSIENKLIKLNEGGYRTCYRCELFMDN